MATESSQIVDVEFASHDGMEQIQIIPVKKTEAAIAAATRDPFRMIVSANYPKDPAPHKR